MSQSDASPAAWLPGLIERRSGSLQASSQGKLAGYAAVFSSESQDLGGFREIVRPGAFKASLASGKNIRALWHHQGEALLGTTAAKTLRMREDHKGLAFELDLPDTSHGRDLRVLVERGDVAGCSFAFRAIDDSWTARGVDWLRELITVELAEITLTADPAYPDTSVALRSLTGRASGLRHLWLQTVRWETVR